MFVTVAGSFLQPPKTSLNRYQLTGDTSTDGQPSQPEDLTFDSSIMASTLSKASLLLLNILVLDVIDCYHGNVAERISLS